MNCLKCGNYWQNEVDELMCIYCPYANKDKEKKKDAN